MKCARHIARIVMLVAVWMAAASCGVSKIKDIKVNSFDVKYVTPTSARSLDAVLLLGINNPAMNLVISGLEGTVKYNDKAIAVVSAGTIPLEKKTDKVYEIPCTASLVDGVSLLSLFPLLANPDPKGLNVDVHLRVANKKGIGTDLVFNDLSIAKFTR